MLSAAAVHTIGFGSRLGYGGDRKVADLLSMNVHTVARGRKELLVEDLDLDRVRAPGGGMRPIKKTPQVIVEIEELMKYEAAGDPM